VVFNSTVINPGDGFSVLSKSKETFIGDDLPRILSVVSLFLQFKVF